VAALRERGRVRGPRRAPGVARAGSSRAGRAAGPPGLAARPRPPGKKGQVESGGPLLGARTCAEYMVCHAVRRAHSVSMRRYAAGSLARRGGEGLGVAAASGRAAEEVGGEAAACPAGVCGTCSHPKHTQPKAIGRPPCPGSRLCVQPAAAPPNPSPTLPSRTASQRAAPRTPPPGGTAPRRTPRACPSSLGCATAEPRCAAGRGGERWGERGGRQGRGGRGL
jgi:hypothetical protein